jgi:hypothetical protein
MTQYPDLGGHPHQMVITISTGRWNVVMCPPPQVLCYGNTYAGSSEKNSKHLLLGPILLVPQRYTNYWYFLEME